MKYKKLTKKQLDALACSGRFATLKQTVKGFTKSGIVGPDKTAIKMEYEEKDTVYAYIKTCRINLFNGHEDVIEAPVACLKIEYRAGYPCPPNIDFVNPDDHSDSNSKWWPELICAVDLNEKKLALEHIAPDQSMVPEYSRGMNEANRESLRKLEEAVAAWREVLDGPHGDAEALEMYKALLGEIEALNYAFYNPLRIATGLALHRVRD